MSLSYDELEQRLADSRKVNKQLAQDRRDLMHAAAFPEESDAFQAAEWIRTVRAELVKVTRENARLRRERPVVHLPEEKR